MTDAPARIWATRIAWPGIGEWTVDGDDGRTAGATKYIRADIVEAMRSALADALMALADRRAADAKGYTERASKSVDAALSRISKEQADG